MSEEDIIQYNTDTVTAGRYYKTLIYGAVLVGA
jgi:hypothetical protein